MAVKSSELIREILGIDEMHQIREDLLLSMLEESVSEMLHQSPEKLFQILYRLDVDEAKVRQILKNNNSEVWPSLLASIILERENTRQYWKKKYDPEP